MSRILKIHCSIMIPCVFSIARRPINSLTFLQIRQALYRSCVGSVSVKPAIKIILTRNIYFLHREWATSYPRYILIHCPTTTRS